MKEAAGEILVPLQKDLLRHCCPFVHFRQHNKIRTVEGSQLKAYLSLEMLDLSSNNITEIHSACFPPGLPIREL